MNWSDCDPAMGIFLILIWVGLVAVLCIPDGHGAGKCRLLTPAERKQYDEAHPKDPQL